MSETAGCCTPPQSHGGDEHPLVSVILPVYNGELFIGQAIESVLCQTYTNLEVIVVDDGSADGTQGIVQKYADADARVRCIAQANAGVAHARNRGLAEARGEFVAPLDADDLWDPRKIEHQVRRMREAGAVTGMVYCWWVWIDEAGTVLDRSPSWDIEGRVEETLLRINFTGNASVPLYRRSCLEEVAGYDPTLERRGGRGCEDWDVALKIAARFEVAVVRELLVGYRRLRNSMSTQCDVMWRSYQLVADGVAERSPAMNPEILRHSSQQFALYIAGVMFRCGAYFHSAIWLLRAWRSSLLPQILPYVIAVFVKRIRFGRLRTQEVMMPGTRLKEENLPEPLIPYDKIYRADKSESKREKARSFVAGSRTAQVLLMILGFLFVAWLHRSNDGLWFQGDSPRHAATGLFWYDAIAQRPASLTEFALRYYARYPIINPLSYPPLFYLLEAAAFAVFGTSVYAAKGVILAFAIMLGLYTLAWARRWLGPEAGWAAAFLPFIPGIAVWTNAIMLNIPATALGMACLYHWRRWSEAEARKHLWACIAFGIGAALTYYQGGIAIAVCLAWTVLFRRTNLRHRLGILLIAATALIGFLPVVLSARFMPVFLNRQLPSVALLKNSETWSFYPAGMPSLLGVFLLGIGIAGFLAGMSDRKWRREMGFLAGWIMIPIAAFSLLPAKDTRYVLLIAPAFLLAGAVAAIWLGRKLALRLPRTAIAAVAGGFIIAAWSASLLQIPQKSGFEAVADYLRLHAPHDVVVYDGYHDGLFTFYVRALDNGYQRRVVLAQQLLYHYGPESTFDWRETENAKSVPELVELLRTKSGTAWVAVEVGPFSEWAWEQRLLRRAVTGPDFELVRSFPVQAPNAQRVDLYRLRGAITPVSTVDVHFASFSNLTFYHVVPITR